VGERGKEGGRGGKRERDREKERERERESRKEREESEKGESEGVCVCDLRLVFQCVWRDLFIQIIIQICSKN